MQYITGYEHKQEYILSVVFMCTETQSAATGGRAPTKKKKDASWLHSLLVALLLTLIRHK